MLGGDRARLRRRAVLRALPMMALAPVVSARAQTIADIDQRTAAVIEAWAKTPLTIRRAVFVTQRPSGFGIYDERSSKVFKPGEPLVVYAEPVGYGWKSVDQGLYEFGFMVDFDIKAAAGNVLASKQDFARLAERSHAMNQEFMLTLTLNVNGAPSGDYVLEYTLRDIAGPKSTTITLPFTIAA